MTKKFKKIGLFLTFFLIVIGSIQAQEIEVSGTVSSVNGETVPGVNIFVQGTNRGAVTNMEGEYSIEVEPDAVLVFSSIGYVTKEISVNGNAEIDVVLEEDVQALEETVVIGYGEVKRRDLTGSVVSIDQEDIVRTPTSNPLDAIKGRVPGMDITRSSGEAGADVNITIRGNRSIGGSNEPLYVIDGFQGGSISDLNPNDIESIEVLKDASATAIYGSQGANGVILVTTKSGKAGKTLVSYDGYYGINGLAEFPEMRTGEDYIRLRREAFRTEGLWNSPEDDRMLFANAGEWEAVQNNQWVDWTDLLIRDGIQQSHTVSVSGGGEKTKVYFSGGFFREEGMLRGDNMNRFTGRFKITHEINSWAEAGVNGQLAYYDQNYRITPLAHAMTMSPFGVPFNENGEINLTPIAADPTLVNPLVDERPYVAKYNEIRSDILFNAYVEINPIEGLQFRSNFGTNLENNRDGFFESENAFAQRNSRLTQAGETQVFNRFFNWDNILTYSRSFGDHDFTITGITNYIQSDADELIGEGNNQALATQYFYNLGATETESRFLYSSYVGYNQLSFAGRLNYDYLDRYILTLTNRYDGASRLAPGNKWASFPSIAAAWILSDEPFFNADGVMNFAKIRASYGVAGNSGIDPYGTQSVLESRTNLNFGGVPATFYLFSDLVGNPSLGWEKTATANLGLDFEFFNSRLKATVDVYQANTTDLLLPRFLPQSTGVTRIYENIGETRNRGIEVFLNSQNIVSDDFNWTSTLTFTKNNEEIISLVDGEDIIQQEDNSRLLGRPINSFYSYDKLGIWQISEAEEAAALSFGGTPFQPGDIKLEDVNGDSVIDEADRQYLGSSVPDFVIGLQNTFRYKSFDLSAFVFARWGQMINAEVLGRYNPSGERNGPAFMDYWTPENPTNDFPRPRRGASLTNYAGYQSLNFIDGSFIKLQNISLGYTLPDSITDNFLGGGINQLRIYGTGSNLWTYAKSPLLREYDPERGGEESFPLTKTIVFGLNISL
ncbi:SusC/RagA family TonB-linked outer membrane protein [Autumnicola musiva]|uniref:TonB-dependent receptor n=1 Tax=Autumnicola musiva TaxID=3075589 RepID=A0ABU3D7U4_9FLAO|nr:TonB-dependent receptor [Zunongwangia sp. F117]MDT0677574.1 TonB-dependent receptor [Zunongwangia sp. F117]